MSLAERKIPPFMYRKSNLVTLVVFTAVFALSFINLYKPFNSTDWYNISKFEYFLYSSLLILTGVMVVVISRIVMYYYTKKRTISYWEYAVWVLIEIVLMSACYTFISYSLDETRDFWDVFKASAKNTSLVLLLPYTISILYFSMQEKNMQINELKKSTGEEGKEDSAKVANIISFYDDKGGLRLSIKKESLIYIESADNYVSIWYLGKKGITKFLLRNSLKNMEDKFINTNIVRCHRSFMVNLDQVKVAKKGKTGIYLDFGIDTVPEIPVSKGYGDKVTKWLISSMA